MAAQPVEPVHPRPMKRREMRVLSIRVVAILALLASIAVPGLYAQSGGQQEIRTLLDQRDREIKTLLGQKDEVPRAEREKLKALINGVIDFRAMSETALGAHWAELSPAQRNEFVEVFSEIVRAQSLSNLDVYRSKVVYEEIEVSGSSARVRTSVTFKNVPTQVEYLMARRGGEWRVDDIVLDRVSTAEGYARSFQPVVKRRGFDTLMASLRKKLDQVSQTS